MTMNKKKGIQERGTLLIEAIAMLGLIAMVTPTLYKKSAERLQEIQDINAAGQARIFNNVIETFIKSEFGELIGATSSAPYVIELALNNSSGAGYYQKGYSSYVPYGYVPGDIKNYGNPRVFVRNDNGKLISYILFPVTIDPGKKRAARMASLVGANGGIVTKPFTGGNDLQADGTGGAWALDKDMLQDLISHGASSASSLLVENSLMVTSTEPIAMTHEDSEKFLYRVPPDESGDPSEYYHNTMVTNLYMGGIPENTSYSLNSREFNSIYNVRRLTLNTDCNYDFLNDGDSSQLRAGGTCEPEVADLYIGKPFAGVSSITGTLDGNKYERGFEHSGNTGAAWIYGNLSALKDNFRLFREGAGGGRVDGYDTAMERAAGAYDVLEFARVGSSSSNVDFSVFRAQNSESSAEVAMLDSFMVARMGSSNVPEFSLGKGTSGSNDGSLIYAQAEDDQKVVYINGNGDSFGSSRITHINRQGGTVYINGSSVAGGRSDTIINDGGGQLQAGKSGDWILAEGDSSNANLYLLQGSEVSGVDARTFAVGNSSAAENHMVWANSSVVSLRGGLLRAYGKAKLTAGSNSGGRDNIAQYDGDGPALPAEGTGFDGQIALTSKYTDVLGSAYFGSKNMSSGVDGLNYSRDNWRLGVAGSAWVDDLLFARDAWFHRSGFRELHAGFSSYTAYNDAPEKGWLNVYDDKVVIRDPAVASSGASGHLDTMFYADDSRVRIFDKQGGAALFEDGMAKIGYTPNESSFSNLFVADSWSANVIGSSLVKIYTGTDTTSSKVNIQENAMLFSGHGGDLASTEARSNTIEARAGQFAIQTANKGQDIEDNMQFYIDKDEARVKYVNLGVYDDNSAAVFQVMPNEDFASDSSSANVQVRGSFHVTGNEVFHVASNADNRAGKDAAVGRDKDAHAMLEVDPEYVQIWAKDGENYAKGPNYFAMLKVDPSDIHGGAVSSTVLNDASVYIRRGAIELEQSVSGSSYAADEGYGYIKANRFVSNAADVSMPARLETKEEVSANAYDQFMVNPAYTSVMHDIKLTTRGGARLSDILPDYVLKGVYNLANNRQEENQNEVNDMSHWAHPYIGKIPYAVCPPGYRNLATIVPISFRMGEAGDIMLAKDEFDAGLSGDTDRRYIVNPSPRHAKNLAYAALHTDGRILNDLTLQQVSSLVYNEVYKSASSFTDFQNMMQLKTEGWFWGLEAVHKGSSWSDADLVSVLDSDTSQGVQFWIYEQDKGNNGATKVTIPTPIYFQQNTWLKTSLVPDGAKGWNAYMGFLYNTRYWSDRLGGIEAKGTVRSNYNAGGGNESDVDTIPEGDDHLVWNLFPVPTYSLEGHGTVYCYFDRKEFYTKDGNWKNYIDNIDQLGALRKDEGKGSSETGADFRGLEAGKDSDYVKRLNDPSLKYDDPW